MFHPEYSHRTNGYNHFTNVVVIISALWAFVGTTTWEETQLVLNELQGVLLSDAALDLLQKIVTNLYLSGERMEAEDWGQHLALLEAARAYSIAEAWKSFMVLQHEIGEALSVLTSATTEDEIYHILTEKQSLLLTNTALVMLYDNIKNPDTQQEQRSTEHLERLLDLLEDARRHGLVTAWKRFRTPRRFSRATTARFLQSKKQRFKD